MSGKMIYHYTNYEAAQSIIESKNIRLVSSLSMSDRTDRFFANLYTTTFLLTSKDSRIKEVRENVDIKDILSVNFESLQIPFFSASFCLSEGNQYLWENYASNHKGVCIAFNSEYLLKQIRNILCENFTPIDEGEKADDYVKDIIPLRHVYYGDAEEFVVDVVRKTDCFDEYYKRDNPNAYRNWLARIYAVVAGVIKANDYKCEEEIRLLFQKCVSNNLIYSSDCYRFKAGISKLGMCSSMEEKGKQYFALHLEEFFTSELLPQIVLGKDFPHEKINSLKESLQSNGLTETVINDCFMK